MEPAVAGPGMVRLPGEFLTSANGELTCGESEPVQTLEVFVYLGSLVCHDECAAIVALS